jgi:hypothetical protein
MGHFIGSRDGLFFVHDDGKVWTDEFQTKKVANSEDEFWAERKPKKMKKERPLMTCPKCGREGFKGKVGLERHMKRHQYNGRKKRKPAED